jgi:hypothetical protein
MEASDDITRNQKERASATGTPWLSVDILLCTMLAWFSVVSDRCVMSHCDLQKLKHVVSKNVDTGHDHYSDHLLKQISDLQQQLQRVKHEMKKMERKHYADMRIRDRKEMILFVLLAACCVTYGCVALLTRGFL